MTRDEHEAKYGNNGNGNNENGNNGNGKEGNGTMDDAIKKLEEKLLESNEELKKDLKADLEKFKKESLKPLEEKCAELEREKEALEGRIKKLEDGSMAVVKTISDYNKVNPQNENIVDGFVVVEQNEDGSVTTVKSFKTKAKAERICRAIVVKGRNAKVVEADIWQKTDGSYGDLATVDELEKLDDE